MTGFGVRQVCRVEALLGEGPLWLDGALWFVDIKQRRVHRFEPGTEELQTWAAPDQVGWVQPAADGTMLAGLKTGLHRFDPASGRFDLLMAVEPDRPGNRLNDSCVDPAGRLWTGTMDEAERAPTGRIYRVDARGVVPMADGITITNGPAVSPAGDVLYHCDTVRGVVHACALDAGGAITASRVFVTIDVARDGHPDGPIVDAEDHLWIAFYGGWCVRRYAPDGRLVAEIRMPVANPTKIAIGGPDGHTAYVTSAARNLSEEERARQPLAGDLLAFDAGVGGQNVWPVAAVPPVV